MALTKQEKREKIKKRIRKTIRGSNDRPRMTVFRSNKHIYAQIIDDQKGHTLVSASSLSPDFNEKEGNSTKFDQAQLVGDLIADRAINKGINKVVFDRNGYQYHGRVKNLAEAARKKGLKF